MEEITYFFSYTHKDSEFALKLAKELRAAGVELWLDQLDIFGGQRWDSRVEAALETSRGMIVVPSPESLSSNNVIDEVSYALEEGKLVLPVLLHPCDIRFRLRRVQYIDFTAGYDAGFSHLLRALRRVDQPSVMIPFSQTDKRVAQDSEEGLAQTAPVLESRYSIRFILFLLVGVLLMDTAVVWEWRRRFPHFRPGWHHRPSQQSRRNLRYFRMSSKSSRFNVMTVTPLERAVSAIRAAKDRSRGCRSPSSRRALFDCAHGGGDGSPGGPAGVGGFRSPIMAVRRA